MPIVYNVPIVQAFITSTERKPGHAGHEPIKIESVLKGFNDSINKEGVRNAVKKKRDGGSPSSLRHRDAQRKRAYIISKIKDAHNQKRRKLGK